MNENWISTECENLLEIFGIAFQNGNDCELNRKFIQKLFYIVCTILHSLGGQSAVHRILFHQMWRYQTSKQNVFIYVPLWKHITNINNNSRNSKQPEAAASENQNYEKLFPFSIPLTIYSLFKLNISSIFIKRWFPHFSPSLPLSLFVGCVYLNIYEIT